VPQSGFRLAAGGDGHPVWHQTLDDGISGSGGFPSPSSGRSCRFPGTGWLSVADSLWGTFFRQMETHMDRPMGVECLAERAGYSASLSSNDIYRPEKRLLSPRNGFKKSRFGFYFDFEKVILRFQTLLNSLLVEWFIR